MRSHVHASLHMCKISSTSEKSPVPKSLSTMQSHLPNRNFVVATELLVTSLFCFHNYALCQMRHLECFSSNSVLGYTNLRSHVQFQVIKSNRLCRKGGTWKLTLMHRFLQDKDCMSNRTGPFLPQICRCFLTINYSTFHQLGHYTHM